MRHLAALCTAALATFAHAQTYLMIPDSGTIDRIMLFDADGNLINQNWLVDGPPTWDFNTPKDVIQVGNEIWVSDQVADAIFCFSASLTPEYIRTISGGLDNMRGMGVVGDHVYVSNAGTANGAPGNAVIKFAFDGTRITHWAAPSSPFDCTDLNGDVLVPDSTTHRIDRWSTNGTYLGVFHAGAIRFPEQAVVVNTGPAGAQEVWVAGFTSPHGIYRYDAESGAQVAYYNVTTSGGRGVHILPNGDVLFTEGTAVKRFTPGSTASTVLTATGMTTQYIGVLTLGASCDGDVNCDGAVNGVDVEVMELAVGGDLSDFCQPDPDFNQDGAVNGTDVEAVELVVGGAPCP
ncbi:MAG: hypothetical protein HBSAPP03_07380 [Phycisphaerae bacterium]|nr:MAG: hypothetical protein HBSAPP03_07380 [Phycisphaerae bacterium]